MGFYRGQKLWAPVCVFVNAGNCPPWGACLPFPTAVAPPWTPSPGRHRPDRPSAAPNRDPTRGTLGGLGGRRSAAQILASPLTELCVSLHRTSPSLSSRSVKNHHWNVFIIISWNFIHKVLSANATLWPMSGPREKPWGPRADAAAAWCEGGTPPAVSPRWGPLPCPCPSLTVPGRVHLRQVCLCWPQSGRLWAVGLGALVLEQMETLTGDSLGSDSPASHSLACLWPQLPNQRLPGDLDAAAECTGAGAAAAPGAGSGLELGLGLGASPRAARNPALTRPLSSPAPPVALSAVPGLPWGDSSCTSQAA